MPLSTNPQPARSTGITLVERMVQRVSAQIDEGVIGPGAKVPSIRAQALLQGVSRFTVVDAYERLVALGYLESRKGSGFYARQRPKTGATIRRDNGRNFISSSWLVWNQFGHSARANMPGSALLPGNWLDADMIATNLRAVGRQNLSAMLHYGLPAGFLPLRSQLRLKLAELEIAAKPEQIVLTSGVTQALDIVCREIMSPGDTILVDDPAWYRMFAMFASMGLKVVGIPRLADGPDIQRLEQAVREHSPKIFLVNSVLHNPTGTSVTAAKAHSILQIAEREDFLVIETDVFGDFHGGTVARLANLDQLRRVIYMSSFSKTLSATLRVGYIACAPELAQAFIEQKLKSCLTTSELGERVVHKILSEGHYRKHMARIRNRVAAVREPTLRKLEALGLRIPVPPLHGVIAWADTGVDTDAIALEGLAHDYVFAPGSLFTPDQAPSTWMRFNLATSASPHILAFLARQLE
ncbi:MAG: PLP-dependent aminotransferase family protein [Burkholderiaceae bacterium]|nr:PLP-dependent aminotransferase family protein [Burkholderiaceae bacterium]